MIATLRELVHLWKDSLLPQDRPVEEEVKKSATFGNTMFKQKDLKDRKL